MLVQQQGLDLAVHVTDPAGAVRVFEGPDGEDGVEVVLIEGSRGHRLRIEVQPAYGTVRSDSLPEAIELGHPSPGEIRAARVLATNSARWEAGADAQWVRSRITDDLIDRAGRLAPLLWRQRIDSSVASADWKQALREAERYAAEVPSLLDLHHERAWLLGRMAHIQLYLDDNEAGVASANSALELLRLSDADRRNQFLLIQLMIDRGGLMLRWGRERAVDSLFVDGISDLETAQERASTLGFPGLEGRASEFLALSKFLSEGRGSKAGRALLDVAEALYRTAGKRGQLATVLNNRASGELGRGNFGLAGQLYLEALAANSSSRHTQGRAQILTNLAFVHAATGAYDRAEVNLREALSVLREMELPSFETRMLLVDVLRAQSALGAALDAVRETEIESSSLEARVRASTAQGRIQLALSRLDDAVVSLARADSALRLAGESSSVMAVRTVYRLELELLRAELAMRSGNVERALRVSSAALGSVPEFQIEALPQIELMHVRSEALFETGRFEQGLSSARGTLQLIGRTRGRLDVLRQTPGWGARTSFVLDDVTARLVSRHRIGGGGRWLEEAWQLMRESRARKWLERKELRRIQASAALDRSKQATAQASIVRAALDGGDDVGARREYVRSTRVAERGEGLRLLSNMTTPRYLSMADLQRRLNTKQIALSFHLGRRASHVFVIQSEGLHVFELPSEQLIEARIREAMVGGVVGGWNARLRNLSQALLPPEVVEMLESSEVHDALIEPHGLVALVPFAALLLSDGRYLVDSVSVSMIPSFDVYFEQSQAMQFAGDATSIRIVADPSFGDPGADGSEVSVWRGGIDRVPYTRHEASRIRALFAPDQATLMTGAEATVSSVLDEASRSSDILHIATHGFASATDPLFLGLALSSKDSGQVMELLTVDQISQLEFDNDLVVISGCHTAGGRLLKGEGIASVASAFLASGARRTVATLWPVSDRATAKFMELFYRELRKQARSPAVALQRAQRLMSQDSRFSNPNYWAGMVFTSLSPD